MSESEAVKEAREVREMLERQRDREEAEAKSARIAEAKDAVCEAAKAWDAVWYNDATADEHYKGICAITTRLSEAVDALIQAEASGQS